MKKFLIGMIAFIILFALVPSHPAQANFITGNWTSSISCINQSDTEDAAVELLFYEEGTGVKTSLGTTAIPAGKSTNFVISGLPDGAIGSVVVESSQPVTCSVDYSAETTGTKTNPYRFAAERGFDQNEIGPVMYVSQIEKDFYGWNSYIAIQNTTANPVDITIDFVDRNKISFPSLSMTVAPFANEVVLLGDVPTLPSSFIGGATVSSDDGVTPLAVSTAFYNSGVSPETSQIHAWNGSSKGSHTLYAPYIVMLYYGYNSGIMVQNIGDTPTSFKITYTFDGKDYVYQYPSTLGVGEAKDFYLPDVQVLAPVAKIHNNLRYGKAVITATNINGTFNPDGVLIANVNQENRGGRGVQADYVGNGGTYGAFLATGGSRTNYIAKWMVHVGGFSSGFHISNFSSTSVTCDFTFSDAPGANFTRTIDANSFFTRWAPDVSNLPTGYNGGVKISCDANVYVITNAASDPNAGKFGDSFYQMSAGPEFTLGPE